MLNLTTFGKLKKKVCTSYNSVKEIILLTIILSFISNTCYSTGSGSDILANPAADLFATFKGTIISLLIMAEIIGAYKYWHVTKDITKAVTGLVFVLLLTGWASTKF